MSGFAGKTGSGKDQPGCGSLPDVAENWPVRQVSGHADPHVVGGFEPVERRPVPVAVVEYDPATGTYLGPTCAKGATLAADTDSADDCVLEDSASAEAAPDGRSGLWSAIAVGAAAIVALGAVAGWLGVRYYQADRVQQQNELFLQTARQGAVNLTTISHEHAEADVQRILDSATGQFYDDFQGRAQPFVDVVKQAKSVSEGTITAAGLEKVEEDRAQALVSVSVDTSNAGAAEQQPRLWRMRIDVERMGDAMKVANVQFVP